MKAMITGAGGQLGTALLTGAPAGWNCIALSRSDLDLTNPVAIAAQVARHSPDVIFNAAAYTAVDRAEADQENAFLVNCEAVRHIESNARKNGAHLVHISTDFVFDGAASQAYRPGDVRNPLSVYGRSKAAGEDAAGEGASIIRTSWVYGATGSNFVKTMLRLMSVQESIRVVDDQIGAPTWTNSLADVVWAIGTQKIPGIYHFTDAGVASWYDFAVAIQEEALGLGLLTREVAIQPIRTAEYPTPARRPRFSVLDSSATRAVTGKMSVHWRSCLRQMLRQLRTGSAIEGR